MDEVEDFFDECTYKIESKKNKRNKNKKINKGKKNELELRADEWKIFFSTR